MRSLLCLLLVLFAGMARGQEGLVIHEWGTFTSLQDVDGRTIGGINTDDERLPDFVKTVRRGLINTEPLGFKGVGVYHRDVTMRLETPVVYFHPPAGSGPLTLDFSVAFKSGWLTEYYPDAVAVAPGLTQEKAGRITPETVGTLTWKGLTVGGDAVGPDTKIRAWLAPRDVKAASVRTAAGQSERYLFYRGVGNLNAPIRVAREEGELRIFAQAGGAGGAPTMKLGRMWFVDIRSDGATAFRTLAPVTVVMNDTKTPVVKTPSMLFDGYSKENMKSLRQQMHAALVEDGMFADEAHALLNTWEVSYFQMPGQRLFFLLPQEWTDRQMPITVSTPAKIVRSMVGRIELVTPEMRARVTAAPSMTTVRQLGRFAGPLLLDEHRRKPTEGLAKSLSLLRIYDFEEADKQTKAQLEGERRRNLLEAVQGGKPAPEPANPEPEKVSF